MIFLIYHDWSFGVVRKSDGQTHWRLRCHIVFSVGGSVILFPIVQERMFKNAYSNLLSSYLTCWRYTDARKFISVKLGGIIFLTNQMKRREQKRTEISWKRTLNLSKEGSSLITLVKYYAQKRWPLSIECVELLLIDSISISRSVIIILQPFISKLESKLHMKADWEIRFDHW